MSSSTHQQAETIDTLIAKLVDNITIAGYGKKDHPNPLIEKGDKQPFAGYKYHQDETVAALSAMVAEITGEDESHTKRCKEYGNAQQIDKFCICNARVRNILRIEQRQRAKGFSL